MMITNKLVIGIDASRNRSGGGKAHILGLFNGVDPAEYGIQKVHVWGYKSLMDAVPDYPWLMKHTPHVLQKSLPRQLWWQFYHLAHEARACGCDVLFNTDAGSVCTFHPAATLSQDMLPYEPGEISRLGLSWMRFRYIFLSYIQSRAMRSADGVIFLTKYASDSIQRSLGKFTFTSVIPHGIDQAFRDIYDTRPWPASSEHPIRCLYVSSAAPYKHQWVVIRAIADLRKRGYNLHLTLAGGGSGPAQRLLDAQVATSDTDRKFVQQLPFVRHSEVPRLLSSADLFIFASSCENLPITLLEGMAAGLPIACSDRGPMPEVLQNGGIYFDPEDDKSIACAIEKILVDESLRTTIAKNARYNSEQYSWNRCASETFKFLKLIATKSSSSVRR